MDRRSFLKALGAGAVSVTIPLCMADAKAQTMEGRLPLTSKLSGQGIGIAGNEILQGNEEALMCYTASIKAELNHGQELRVSMDIGNEWFSKIFQFNTEGSPDYQRHMCARIMADVFNDWIEHNPKLPRFHKITTKQVENAIKLVV